MSYAIFTIMYGLPLSVDDNRSRALEKLVDREPEGVHTLYSGSASLTPAGFGVVLGNFNECCHHIELSDLPLVATPQQQKEYAALVEALSEKDRAVLAQLGEARVFFLVNSS